MGGDYLLFKLFKAYSLLILILHNLRKLFANVSNGAKTKS